MRHALLAAAALFAALAWTAHASDAGRGKILYEARCGGCHAESVHGRAKREATDFQAVRAWVRRWGENLGLKWTDDEISDVAAYLNGRYYRYACPPAVCQASGSLDTGSPVARLDGRFR
jgi:mono/diheme cytochrome c family protein